MRVVADSQAIIWYLSRPERLSERALETLGSAEDSDGIVVSSWTVPELWMAATRKRGPNAVDRANYELVRSTLLDADSAVDVEPFGSAMWAHFEVVSTEQEHLQKPSGM